MYMYIYELTLQKCTPRENCGMIHVKRTVFQAKWLENLNIVVASCSTSPADCDTKVEV